MTTAAACGFAHADHWLATLTARQLQEWRAMHAIQPVGEPAADLRHAFAAAQFAAVHRAKGAAAPQVSKYLITNDAEIAAAVEQEDNPGAYMDRLAQIFAQCQTPSP